MSRQPFDATRKGTGTKEWAETTYNVGLGCSHACRYCYARADALRFKRVANNEDWARERLINPTTRKPPGKKQGVIMLPSTHDITPFYLAAVTAALIKILKAGNQVLIVSKPHLECIHHLCKEMGAYDEQVMFRFTIGSLDPAVCGFWELGAPTPEERLAALEYAYSRAYRTSVSIEPMLADARGAIAVYNRVARYVTDTIWIGKMNKARTRVDMGQPDNVYAVEQIEQQQADKEILALIDALATPKVRWKDSIKKVLAAHKGLL